MTFQLHALPYAPFAALFDLSDSALKDRGMQRVHAESDPGFPCRVSLQDAALGEELVLLNYQHLAGNTPFAASHAIFIRKGAVQAHPLPGEIPAVLVKRLLSVRAFDAEDQMVTADVTDGTTLGPMLDTFLANPRVAFVHLHTARQGCFAARATRARDQTA